MTPTQSTQNRVDSSELAYEIRELNSQLKVVAKCLYVVGQELKAPNVPLTDPLYGCEKLVLRIEADLEKLATQVERLENDN